MPIDSLSSAITVTRLKLAYRVAFILMILRLILILQALGKPELWGYVKSAIIAIGNGLVLVVLARFRYFRTLGLFMAISSPLFAFFSASGVGGLPSVLIRNVCTSAVILPFLSGALPAFTSVILVSFTVFYYLFLHLGGFVFPQTLTAATDPRLHFGSYVLTLICTYFAVYAIDDERNKHITALHLSKTQQQKVVMELAQEDKKLRNAVAEYSHEIRTPLNVVIAMAESTVELCSEGEGSREAMLLQAAARSLLALSNNVLDVSAMEAGALRMESYDFDLEQTLQQMQPSVNFAAQQKDLRFEVIVSDALPTMLCGDGVRLQQVLYNLLGNAIRATTTGSVTLTAEPLEGSPLKQSDSSTVIRFCITDTGCGIPAELGDTLFDKVMCGSSSAGTDLASSIGTHKTSLGLYLSKKLVKRMGGRICIASTLSPRGTVVMCDIPFDAPTHVEDSSPQQQQHHQSVRALRLLYADDEPANHFVLSTLLHGTPHTLVMANDGLEAVTAFQREPFDLIFLDVDMPVMNGVQAMQAIRKYEKQKRMKRHPLAFLTAHASPQFAEMDIDDVISKPVGRAWIRLYVADVAQKITQAEALAAASAALLNAPAAKDLHEDSSETSSTTTSGSATPNMDGTPRISIDGTRHREGSRQEVIRAVPLTNRLRVVNLIRQFFTLPDSADPSIMWKFRVCCYSFAFFAMMLVLELLKPWHIPAENIGNVISHLSCMMFMPLVRLQRPNVLAAYTVIQQLGTMVLIVFTHPLGIRTLQYELVIPPAITLIVGTSPRVCKFLSVAAAVQAYVLIYLLPPEPLPLHLETQFLSEDAVLHVAMMISLMAVSLYSEVCRRTAYDALVASVSKIQKLDAKTLAKRNATEQFSQVVAYEFRMPLSIVLGMAEALFELKTLPRKVTKQMLVLQSACHLLLNMMRNMIELRSTIAREVALSPSVFPLAEAVLQTARILAFHARTRSVVLRVRLASDIPVYVNDDRGRLQQMLANVLGHAIKSAQAHNIVLLRVEPDAPTELSARCTRYRFATDNSDDEGIVEEFDYDPVPTQAATLAFEHSNIGAEQRVLRFSVLEHPPLHSRADVSAAMTADASATATPVQSRSASPALRLRPRKRVLPSLAVDLASKASQEVARQYGGSVGFDEHGMTRSSLLIPMTVASAHDLETPRSGVSPTPALAVLIVDDVLEIQYCMQLYLRNTPHVVSSASTGAAALQLFQQSQFSVVLVPNQLSDMTGADLIQKLRSVKHRSFVVVMLAAVVTVDVKRAAIRNGADIVETRPISRSRLYSLLHEIGHKISPPSTPTAIRTPGRIPILERIERELAQQVPRQLALQSLNVSAVDIGTHTAPPRQTFKPVKRPAGLQVPINTLLSDQRYALMSPAGRSAPLFDEALRHSTSPRTGSTNTPSSGPAALVATPDSAMVPPLVPRVSRLSLASVGSRRLINTSLSLPVGLRPTIRTEPASPVVTAASKSPVPRLHLEQIPRRLSRSVLPHCEEISSDSDEDGALSGDSLLLTDDDDAELTALNMRSECESLQLSTRTDPPAAARSLISCATSVGTEERAPSAAFPAASEQPPANEDVLPEMPAVIALVPAEMFEYVRDQYMPQLHSYADELLAASRGNDVVAIRAVAHKVTGCAGVFGLHHIVVLSKRITALCHAQPFDPVALDICIREFAGSIRATTLECAPDND
eukprot:TRINITY_DN9737_c0_g1_i1.p1 TRINITY_DN9737_c0_g1~~TRINITY_DN9737_c0_g1_i1.p1  ORF type:complete len:1685 (+),score=358.57 TRINITY_DN9737_c0_g1_i1:110-5164(+)